MIETAERRAFVLKLRKGGATYARIAQAAIDKFGLEHLPEKWDCRFAYKDVARELEKISRLRNGLSEDVLQLELERLDEMQLALWPRVMQGDIQAIQTTLRIMERRARLQGLDKPQRLEHTGSGEGGAIELQIREVVVELPDGDE